VNFTPLFEGHLEKCYFCSNVWGECSCSFCPNRDDDPTAVGFEWEGFFITAPNVSECTRFFVNPIVCYGEAYINSDLCKTVNF